MFVSFGKDHSEFGSDILIAFVVYQSQNFVDVPGSKNLIQILGTFVFKLLLKSI